MNKHADGGRKENQGTCIHFTVLLYKVWYKSNASYFFSFKCDARYSFLLYALESNTLLLEQDHQCSSQSRTFIAVAVQNGRCGHIFMAESGD